MRVEGNSVVRKQPYPSRRGMPYRWVAGGCSRTSDDGVSMHKFPTDASLVSKWSKAIRVHHADWTGPSSSSRLCSLHFTSDCYDRETIMRKKMRLEDKRLNLKEGSIPSFFPSKEDIDAGSETWWNHRVSLMLLHSAPSSKQCE